MSKYKRTSIAIFTSLSAVLMMSAGMASTADKIPGHVFDLYESAATGDKSATKEVFSELTKLRKENPKDTLINAALGSTETMVARDAWIPWKKLKFAEQGLNRMDKAMRSVERNPMNDFEFAGMPADLWVKTTVGCTFIEMPAMFDRLEAGYQILTDTIESENTQAQDVSSIAPLFLCAGLAAKQSGDADAARKYLTVLVSDAPQTDEAVAAKDLLVEL